jgi:hypothetical protein
MTTPPVPLRFILDTHIYDEIVAVAGMPERLATLRNAGKIEILQTHIERNEVARNPDEAERDAGLTISATRIPTSGGLWDVSNWDEMTWDDGAGDVKIGDIQTAALNHSRDALIGTSAAAYADVLVTHDGRLTNRMRENSTTEVWNFVRFKAYVDSL